MAAGEDLETLLAATRADPAGGGAVARAAAAMAVQIERASKGTPVSR